MKGEKELEKEESAKSRGLRGCVGCVGAWVTWVQLLRGLRGLRGSKSFLRGSTIYVGHNFYVGCVGQNFLHGSLRGSKFFCLGQFFGGSSKKISIGALAIIS